MRVLWAALRKLLQIVGVASECVRKIAKLERQHIRIGGAHHDRSGQLRKRAAVFKRSAVGKVLVPVDRIVHRMIDTAAVAASKAKVERRDPDMLQEGCVVRARTESGDSEVSARLGDFSIFLGAG